MTKTEGILIGKSPLTETSLIIHWCTKDCGFIKTVAKGASRPRSVFAGKLDLFFSAEIELARSRSSDLHILREAVVTVPRSGLNSYLRLLAAAYFVKLLELVAEKETPIPELYDLLRRALDHLQRQDPDLRAILYFEKETARILGVHSASSRTGIQAIGRVYQRVPQQRQKVMAALRQQSGPA
ncbi:MAG: DNA repair protein RecO [Verrucomicrobiales bacterium]